MNKGARLCTGEYIAFLNADDWYIKDSIESVVEMALETKSEYIYGNMDLYDGDRFTQTREPKLKKYKKYQTCGY